MIRTISLIFFITCSLATSANIKLPSLVGDNMVLQQQKPLLIWGWADKGETVDLQFKNKKYTTVADVNGKFKINLPAQKAGGPFTMQFSGKNKITLKNILIGDVWICSGQSNMFFKVREANNPDGELATANNPFIRLFAVPTIMAAIPADNVRSKWLECAPATARNFSAVGYFFARHLQEKSKVPVGIIQSAYGATAAESWISAEGMIGEPEFGKEAAMLKYFNLDSAQRHNNLNFLKWVDSVERADPFYSNGNYEVAKQLHPDWEQMKLPSAFDGSSSTLKGKDGIVWFSTSIDLSSQDITDTCFITLKADDDDLVLINGVKVGASRDAKYNNRRYFVDKKILKSGNNIIAIRVIDYVNGGGVIGPANQFTFITPQRIIPLAGNWNYKMSLDTVFNGVHTQWLYPDHRASVLYNAMIAPLTNYRVKGILWYQGESNEEKGYQYRSLFKRLITDWRTNFREPVLPFLFVQLANFRSVDTKPGDSRWAELREAQTMALDLPKTGMAVAIDLGEANDIHPKNKQDVAYRLALQARKIAYDEKSLLASGPMYKGIQYAGVKCTVSFRNEGLWLKTNDGQTVVKGFQVATGNNEFIYADALIKDKSRLEIISPNGKSITAVRYAWADNPGILNLVNSVNLPASPFRTDNFSITTYDKRY